MTTSFNATKDKIGFYIEQAATVGYPEIELRLLRTAEADATLADRATWSALLAAAGSVNLEANFTNYVSKVMSTPTRTVDDTGNRVLLGFAAVGTPVAITWVAAGGTTNNSLVKAVFCYVPTSGAATTAVLPLMATDITATTDGNDMVVTLHTDGFARVISG